MDLSLVQGCTIVPISDLTPVYSFYGYSVSRLDDTDGSLWYIKFDDLNMRDHFMERIEEIGSPYSQTCGKDTLWFMSPTIHTSATLILVSQLASDVIGAADAYYENIECVTDADWVAYP